MTREETSQILTILKVAYPSFYSKVSLRDANAMLNLWEMQFSDVPSNLVQLAVAKLIRTHTGYPPEIADVFREIENMTVSVSNEPSDEELWCRLKKAVSNSTYHAQEEYEALPNILKKFAGSPSGLRDYAVIDSETFNTVTHGQFLKSIKILHEREQYQNSLPEPVRQQITALIGKQNPGYHSISEKTNT